MGTPVLAARAASLPEVLGQSALWVDPTDVEDIRRGIERLDRDPGLRAQLSDAGRENEARFSWDTAVDRVEEVIEDVRRSLRPR